MQKEGWISLHRCIKKHWIYPKKSFTKFEAWLDILLTANHQNNKILLGNDLIEVKRGSFITSELKLMERWGWSKTKLRNFFDLLEKDNMIKKISDKNKTTINIVNYDTYQDSKTTEKPQEDHEETDERPQEDTNNNVNNSNNDNKLNNSGTSPRNKKFTPPSLEEVQAYCKERNNSVEPNKWYDFYLSKDWMIGKNKMKDWKAAVRTWEGDKKQKSDKPSFKNCGERTYNADSLEKMLLEKSRNELGG